jgi:hypothetical protein
MKNEVHINCKTKKTRYAVAASVDATPSPPPLTPTQKKKETIF